MNLLSHYGIFISLMMRGLTAIELLVFCIPLQLKEAHVRDGLRRLRLQLLIFGVTLFLSNLLSIFFLLNIVSVAQKTINIELQLVNSITFLMMSIIGHMMYHSQYTDESKELHKKGK